MVYDSCCGQQVVLKIQLINIGVLPICKGYEVGLCWRCTMESIYYKSWADTRLPSVLPTQVQL
jgi:hypothetical protein